MFLTKQERLCLGFICLVVFCGSLFRIIFHRYPYLNNIVNIVEHDRLYPKIDLNQASLEELIDLPGIGPYTAQRILTYREQNQHIVSVDDIKDLPGVRQENFERFAPYLMVKEGVHE